jgi:hypothetical protein
MSSTSTRESVLIFRTVNVEKMALVLAACCARWPAAAIVVLSSPNRRAELAADPRIAEVVDVPIGPDGFPPRLPMDRRFDAVVVPIGNRGGSGYANALKAARRCAADEYFVMPYASSLQRISRAWLWRATTFEAGLLAMAWPFARLAAALWRPRT